MELENLIQKVEKIAENIRKAGNRIYTKTTNIKKLNELSVLKQEFLDKLESVKESPEKIAFSTIFNTLYEETINTIEINLRKQMLETEVEMANFNLELALKTIPIFTGSYKELDSFVTIIKLIDDSLNETAKPSLLQVILNVKLDNKVKTAIANYNTGTIEDLITQLRNTYKNNTTLPQNGLNDKIKPTVLAAQPKTLTEAVNVASEIESNDTQSIMHLRNSQRFHGNRNFNNRKNYNDNSNRNHNFQNRRNNYNNNRNNNNSNNKNYANENNNHNRRHSNYNNNRNSRRNTNHNNNNQCRSDNYNRGTRRVHVTNITGNDVGSDYNNPDSQN